MCDENAQNLVDRSSSGVVANEATCMQASHQLLENQLWWVVDLTGTMSTAINVTTVYSACTTKTCSDAGILASCLRSLFWFRRPDGGTHGNQEALGDVRRLGGWVIARASMEAHPFNFRLGVFHDCRLRRV